jgi:two-component system sensor histidine kinase RpfC
MRALFASVVRRFRGRPDSEHAQAIVRLVIALLIVGYLSGLGLHHGFDDPDLRAVFIVIGAETVLAIGLLVAIALRPGVSHVRRVLGMVGDYATLAGLMSIHGELLAPLFIVYLWTTIGNGLRYGTRYLAGATVLASASFLVVMASSEYWRENQYLAWGLLFGLVAIPAYQRSLLLALTRAMTEAKQASEAKSRFLANMSHEFRTPLNGIVAMTDLLSGTRMTPEQRECVGVMQASARSLLLLVEDVLDITAIESGKVKRRDAPFRLRDVVRGVTTMLSPMAAEKSLRFEVKIADDVPDALVGDSAHLRQVMVNLVHNAIKFTDRGSVQLAVARTGGESGAVEIGFEVVDTGPGIPEALKPRLFEAFEQGDPSISRRFGGSGLGTTIARTLVDVLGGRIGFADNPGGGTRFWFRVPFARDAQPEAGLAEALPGNVIPFDDPFVRHRARVRSLRVLVADDQPANQLVLRRLLERAGHRPEVVGDGETLLDRLADGGYDAVVLDVHMPGTSGIDVIKQARYLEMGARRTPLIALTADATPETRAAAQLAGVTAFLTKPVVVAELLEALADAAGDGSTAVAEPVRTVRDAKVIEESVLAELASLRLGGDFVRKFTEQCLRDSTRCLAEIEARAEAADWDGVRDACHALKGVAGNMGAAQLAAACSEGMRPGRTDLPREWRDYVRSLHEHLARVRQQTPECLQRLEEVAGPGDRGSKS